MNPAAILSLISDLYQQVAQLSEQLQKAQEQLAKKDQATP